MKSVADRYAHNGETDCVNRDALPSLLGIIVWRVAKVLHVSSPIHSNIAGMKGFVNGR